MGMGVTFAALYLGVFHIYGMSDLPKSDLHFILKGCGSKIYISVLFSSIHG